MIEQIDKDFIAFLVALATAAGDRVHLGNAEQGEPKPVVVVRRTGGQRPRTLSGRALFERSEYAVHVLCDDYADAYPVAAAILDRLAGTRTTPVFVGTMGQTSIKSTRCTRHPSDQSEIDGDKVIRWVEMGFQFMHSEA